MNRSRLFPFQPNHQNILGGFCGGFLGAFAFSLFGSDFVAIAGCIIGMLVGFGHTTIWQCILVSIEEGRTFVVEPVARFEYVVRMLRRLMVTYAIPHATWRYRVASITAFIAFFIVVVGGSFFLLDAVTNDFEQNRAWGVLIFIALVCALLTAVAGINSQIDWRNKLFGTELVRMALFYKEEQEYREGGPLTVFLTQFGELCILGVVGIVFGLAFLLWITLGNTVFFALVITPTAVVIGVVKGAYLAAHSRGFLLGLGITIACTLMFIVFFREELGGELSVALSLSVLCGVFCALAIELVRFCTWLLFRNVRAVRVVAKVPLMWTLRRERRGFRGLGKLLWNKAAAVLP